MLFYVVFGCFAVFCAAVIGALAYTACDAISYVRIDYVYNVFGDDFYE